MSALCLRIIASCCMLLDHIGYLFPALAPLRWIGRLAFPLYAFLLVNGYEHSSNRLRYALRLGLFALLSQIPFCLFCGYRDFLSHGNVFFTLLLALLVLWATDSLTKRKWLRFFAPLPALVVYGLYYFGLLSTDYGAKGLLFALIFFYLRKRPLLCSLASLATLFHINLVSYLLQTLKLLLGREATFTPVTQWQMLQLFALAALPLIFLYNGKKGKTPASPLGKWVLQWSFYLFYPVHMMILYLIA